MNWTGRCFACNARILPNSRHLCLECRVREKRGTGHSFVRMAMGALKVRVDDKRTRSVRDRHKWGEDG